MPWLTAAVTVVRVFECHHLAQNVKVRLVRGECQHDQIRIQSVQHVMCVRIVAGLVTLMSNVVHNLVLTLAGYIGIAQNHRNLLPARI